MINAPIEPSPWTYTNYGMNNLTHWMSHGVVIGLDDQIPYQDQVAYHIGMGNIQH